ncbi:hypothetical protein XENOCAPTIV_015973, partial [Xenoophorus captivus]
VIQSIIKLKPKSKYILAIDGAKNTLEDIVKKEMINGADLDDISEEAAAAAEEQLEMINQSMEANQEHVFALNASDDFLTKRVQGLPRSLAEKMRYTQEEFVPRLARYRQLFSAEETVLNIFYGTT